MDNNFEKDNIRDEEQEDVSGFSAEDSLSANAEDPACQHPNFVVVEEAYAAQKINIPTAADTVPESERRGLKIFCLILALVLVLSCCFTGAYYLGKNSVVENTLQNKPSDATVGTAETVYSSTVASVVGIYVYNNQGAALNTSGLVYSENGYIVTTDSMYTTIPAAKFKVFTNDGKEYSATFVAGDSRSDISVLKIEGNVKLTPIVLGNSDQTVTGEAVYAVGCSNGYNEPAVISKGIVSMASARVTSSVTSYSSKMIQTTVGAAPAVLGGALVNEYGQVIGMLSTKLISESLDITSCAVPSVTLKSVVDSLINDGKVPDRARIGISYIYTNSADAELEGLAAAGLRVVDVDESSELFGILKAKDVITKVNDIDIVRDDIVLDIIETLKPGDAVKLTVTSAEGKQSEYTVKLLAFESVSSYSTVIDDETSSSDGTFDFPEGY